MHVSDQWYVYNITAYIHDGYNEYLAIVGQSITIIIVLATCLKAANKA